MRTLSQSLQDLAARVEVLEESATAGFEANRAKLEQRRHEIDESLKADLDEFESAAREAAAAGRTWWNETKVSMRRPVEEVRARVENRQSEHELHDALRLAETAEQDAAAAIEVATYFLNVAEYAVIDAALARLAADDLAAAASATVGATS
jgi:hypothetical protein